MMRDDFCAFILSHGRPDRVHTYKTLIESGYTGKVYIVIDDEDKTADEYQAKYGDKVLQFCKREYAERLDEGDNTGKRISTIYARAAMFDLAKQVDCKYFIQLDDDYKKFRLAFNGKSQYAPRILVKSTIDDIINAMLNFYIASPAITVAMAQGGDFIGGTPTNTCRRKAMNSFICSSDKPWSMIGRMNEDVNTYVTIGRRGGLFFTVLAVRLEQSPTQQEHGGMTELYLDSGTYVKTFYSIMYAPSCVKVGVMGNNAAENPNKRIHHKINWHRTAPKILREEWKKEQ